MPVATLPEEAFEQPVAELLEAAYAKHPEEPFEQPIAQLFCGTVAGGAATSPKTIANSHESSPHQARAAHRWNGA